MKLAGSTGGERDARGDIRVDSSSVAKELVGAGGKA
jgi:hypothetical protein